MNVGEFAVRMVLRAVATLSGIFAVGPCLHRVRRDRVHFDDGSSGELCNGWTPAGGAGDPLEFVVGAGVKPPALRARHVPPLQLSVRGLPQSARLPPGTARRSRTAIESCPSGSLSRRIEPFASPIGGAGK